MAFQAMVTDAAALVESVQTKAIGLPQVVASMRVMCAVISSRFSGGSNLAEAFLVLLEVTTRLSEVDEATQQIAQAAESEEAETQKWREISSSSMQLYQAILLDQQTRAVQALKTLISDQDVELAEQPPDRARVVSAVPDETSSGVSAAPPSSALCQGGGTGGSADDSDAYGGGETGSS